jgi:hypothetical protein
MTIIQKRDAKSSSSHRSVVQLTPDSGDLCFEALVDRVGAREWIESQHARQYVELSSSDARLVMPDEKCSGKQILFDLQPYNA